MATTSNSTKPSTVKKPQDHKPKETGNSSPAEGQTASQDSVPETVKVVYNGEEYLIETAAVNDLETLEAFENNMLATGLVRMLGEEQYEKFKDAARDEKGRVSIDVVSDFFANVQNAAA